MKDKNSWVRYLLVGLLIAGLITTYVPLFFIKGN